MRAGAAALDRGFYARPVLDVARDLLGCVVLRGRTGGVVVETEAYHEREAACHAHIGRTARTLTLFGAPGQTYVYRSYGVHAMLNVVCEEEGVGAAVLIRALEPLYGIGSMRRRRGLHDRHALCSGPGKLTQALAIALADNGCDTARGPVRILPRPADRAPFATAVGVRIGITKAADLPWRFAVAGHPDVSRPRLPLRASSSAPPRAPVVGPVVPSR